MLFMSLDNLIFKFAYFQTVVSAFVSSWSETAQLTCHKLTNVKSTSPPNPDTTLYGKCSLGERHVAIAGMDHNTCIHYIQLNCYNKLSF